MNHIKSARILISAFVAGIIFSLCPAYSAPIDVPSFPNIAAMKALGAASSFYPVINVQNYSGTSGGGGGVFYWVAASTATTNVCTIFQATGVTTGRWIRQLTTGQNLSVLDCGADSTGIADSTAAFAAAITLDPVVHVPRGLSATYTVTTNALVLATGATFECDGALQDVTIQSFSTTGTILQVGNGAALTQNVTIKNCQIRFDSSVARMSGQRAIFLNWTAYTYITGCDLSEASVNIYTLDSLLFWIQHNKIRSGQIGIDIVPGSNQDGANFVHITDNIINSNTLQAIQANGTGSLSFSDLDIENNDIEANGTHASGLDIVSVTNAGVTGSTSGAVVSKNHFESNIGRSDVSLSANSSQVGLSAYDNTFLSTDMSAANLEIVNGLVNTHGNSGTVVGPPQNVIYGVSASGFGVQDFWGTISNSGSVITSIDGAKPYFHVLRITSSFTVTTDTVVQFNSVASDTGSGWDGTNFRFVAPKAGQWQFNSCVNWKGTSVAGTTTTSLGFFLNGTRVNAYPAYAAGSVTTSDFGETCIEYDVRMNGTTDYLDVRATNTATSPSVDFGTLTDDVTYFSGKWVSVQ